jgi:hypothetical protein
MDETVAAAAVAPALALITCPTCGHRFDPSVIAESSRHLPLECHYDCCRGKPGCFSCRQAFCTCVDH